MKKVVNFTLIALSFFLVSCNAEHTADFDFELTSGEAPIDITFNNTSTNAVAYEWNFGDGTNSKEENPTKTFHHGLTYNVTLTATAKNGEVIQTTKSFTLREAKKRVVEIETEFGIIKAELYNYTPKHRDNFIKLAEEGFYDGRLFHRIIQGFMIQGGAPESKTAKPDTPLGTGELDYTIPAEIVPDASYHYKGALAAARLPDHMNPNRESSAYQFYIVQGSTHTPQQLQQYVYQKAQRGIRVSYEGKRGDYYSQYGGSPILDMEYTVFGQVTEGMHIIDKLAAVPVGANNRPIKDIPMKVRVVE